eukprot:gene9593-1795_t
MFEGELDTKGYKQQVWLVKVPKKVSEAWNSQKSDSLADMKIIGDKVSIDLGDGTEYKLDMSKPAPLYVFSDQEKKNLTLEGKVEHLCTMQPTINKNFEQMLRQRTEDTKKKKTTTSVDEKDVQRVVRPRSHSLMPKKIEKKERRERMDKEKLRDMVQSLFLQTDHWRLNDLADKTEQPVQYLKEEILSEICELNKKGKFQSYYQLKPEYKSQTRAKMVIEEEEFEDIE